MSAVRWSEEDLRQYQARAKREAPSGAVDIDAVHRKREAPKESKLERRLDQQIEDAGFPAPRKNHYFMKGRDLELDRAWVDWKIAVEVQGMAHRIKGKFKRDIEKRALAMLQGWRVLEVDGAAIRDGKAIEWLRSLLWEKMA